MGPVSRGRKTNGAAPIAAPPEQMAGAESRRIALPADFDDGAAETLRRLLLAAIENGTGGPIEIDFEQARRSRERGIRGLGQMMKSFRDRPAEFPVYREGFDTGYLDSLGPVATPRRIDEPAPSNVTTLPVRRSFVK